MDWELKMPWELAELEPNAEAGIGPMVGQGGDRAIQAGHGRLDCSVDLKLGGLGDFGPADSKWKEQQHGTAMATAASSSPSGSSKRARALSSSGQNAACLVDGCKSDLSNCREYHRRHKVCEVHSKTPIVMVGGQEQRFCQQCSR